MEPPEERVRELTIWGPPPVGRLRVARPAPWGLGFPMLGLVTLPLLGSGVLSLGLTRLGVPTRTLPVGVRLGPMVSGPFHPSLAEEGVFLVASTRHFQRVPMADGCTLLSPGFAVEAHSSSTDSGRQPCSNWLAVLGWYLDSAFLGGAARIHRCGRGVHMVALRSGRSSTPPPRLAALAPSSVRSPNSLPRILGT